MSIAPGTRLGPFDVTASLGEGGMGQVFRARDSRLNREVAIKVLPPEFAADPDRMARFAREAQVLASLSHPNIAAIYGLEESGGASALVMELVEGQTLEQRIAEGPIPSDEALAIARQIADALEAAHEKNIVHRDLKPANIKINPEGKVKVLDFGIAKALDADPISGGTAHSRTLTLDSTRAGQIIGTAGYMSPEQARGKPVDRRADIWAFGVVLYEMLTGKSMFEGETVSDTLAAVLRADIDLRTLPAGTPPKVRRLLQRCLERDPKRRLRDIGDAWIEFDAPDEHAAVVMPPPTSKRAWLPWTVAIILGGAGLIFGLLKQSPAPARPVVRWQSTHKGFVGFINVSRDGSRLAYTEGQISSLKLGIRTLDQFEGKPLPGTEGSFFPVFSPDGKWIVFSTTQNKIRKMPVDGGSAITLCDGSTAMGASWGDDDTILFSSGKSLYRVPATGGTPELVTTADAQKGEQAHVYPQLLPGSKQAIFTIGTGSGPGQTTVGLLDVAAKTYRGIARGGEVNRYVPTGHLVYARSGTLFALPFDLGKAAATGNEAPVIEGISMIGPGGSADYSFTDSGLLVYTGGAAGGRQGTTYAWADRKGATQPITTSPQLWGTGRLSPDGTRIANSLFSTSGEGDIWVLEIARGATTRLTFDGGTEAPIWSADGKRIVYGSGKSGKSGIYSVPADGSGSPELIVATERRPTPTSMTPDGKTIVYTAVFPNAPPRIMVFTAGGEPKPLHEHSFQEASGQISPDGNWIAYQSVESGSPEVYVQPFPGPGPKVRISLQGGLSPRWSRNMRELFFWEGQMGRLLSANVQPGAAFSAGTPQEVFAHNSGTTWDVAPDGKRFLIEMNQISNASSGSTLAVVTNWFDELRQRAPTKK